MRGEGGMSERFLDWRCWGKAAGFSGLGALATALTAFLAILLSKVVGDDLAQGLFYIGLVPIAGFVAAVWLSGISDWALMHGAFSFQLFLVGAIFNVIWWFILLEVERWFRSRRRREAE